MPLIELAGEELFHEMGINVDILASLERASTLDTLEPVHRFWALDGIAFSEIKDGRTEKLAQRFEAMEALLTEHEFGYAEQTAYTMKRILFSAGNGDSKEVERLVEKINTKFPNAEYQRIFDYNYAIALWRLKKYKKADSLCIRVIEGYYDLLGISAQDVMGKNSDVLWTIIKRPENIQEHLKHLADALELYATNRASWGKPTAFARIHSMKFYNMVGAGDSMVRVGQDLADQFVGMKDYEGAREVLEQHVLPVINKEGLVGRLVQVRSQYSVILALGGHHKDADAEMQRLGPYLEGLTGEQRQEVENQLIYIAHLSNKASKLATKKMLGTVGRNEPCPCDSGLKYKRCHGA
jgi:tetratricopeptide (TPR) repeat protein